MNSTCKPTRRRSVHLGIAALAVLAALAAAASRADATERRSGRAVEEIETRAAGDPMLAIVSLRSQRITI